MIRKRLVAAAQVADPQVRQLVVWRAEPRSPALQATFRGSLPPASHGRLLVERLSDHPGRLTLSAQPQGVVAGQQ